MNSCTQGRGGGEGGGGREEGGRGEGRGGREGGERGEGESGEAFRSTEKQTLGSHAHIHK